MVILESMTLQQTGEDKERFAEKKKRKINKNPRKINERCGKPKDTKPNVMTGRI